MEARQRLGDVEAELASPEVLTDPDRLRVLGQERAELDPIVQCSEELERGFEELAGAQELADEAEDPEMAALAAEEVKALEQTIETLTARARELLIPRDPLEDRPAVVEIRAGIGGDEAGLFAQDLMRMYTRDVSIGGMFLATSRTLEVGDELKVNVHLWGECISGALSGISSQANL